jgi:glycosyltransferase involved in cell wall biosynthesis
VPDEDAEDGDSADPVKGGTVRYAFRLNRVRVVAPCFRRASGGEEGSGPGYRPGMGLDDGDASSSGGVLLEVVGDRLSDLAAKGEIVARYYNPGDVFDEVHLVLANDDDPPAEVVQELVGRATPHVHRLPTGLGLLVRSAGWRPRLLRQWAAGAVDIARLAGADLVRCHGPHLNALAGLEVKRQLGVPLVVSVHGLPDPVALGSQAPYRGRVRAVLAADVARTVLRGADVVVAVYESLVPWIHAAGAPDVRLVYNAVGAGPRRHEGRTGPFRVGHVGRQIVGKDPTNLVRAIAERPHVEGTIIGDGPLHERVVNAGAGAANIRFERSVWNRDLRFQLADFDAFALHCDYPGLPKTLLEASLAGLPLVVNRRAAELTPEIDEDWCVVVDDSPAGYGVAIDHLADNPELAARLGAAALAKAEATWEPRAMEASLAALHRATARP